MFSSLDLELVVWSCGYARIEATELLPEILAASVAVFSQDLSAPEVSCGVEPVETERSRKCLLGTAAQGLSPGVRTWVLRQVLSS